MVESHYDPGRALSDAQQQLTPENLNKLLNQLTLRHADIPNNLLLSTLEEFRHEIDKYYDNLMEIFDHRMAIL